MFAAYIFLVYLIIPLVVVALAFLTFIPMFKQDNAWYKYEAAYDKWKKNGKVGPMPEPEDFGWKPPKKHDDE